MIRGMPKSIAIIPVLLIFSPLLGILPAVLGLGLVKRTGVAMGLAGVGDWEGVGLLGVEDTKRHISAGIMGSNEAQLLSTTVYKGTGGRHKVMTHTYGSD